MANTKIISENASSVIVRRDGSVQGAVAMAEAACARHGKTGVRLIQSNGIVMSFDCV